MTEGEALAELELSGTTSAGDVRSAYLRLVKQRKPEQDPVGFMRLREAYELLREVSEAQASSAEPSPPTSERERALAWLDATLARIGPDDLRATERIDALFSVHEHFPDEVPVFVRLLTELGAFDGFDSFAKELTTAWLRRTGDDASSEPVWRYALEFQPNLLKRYQLEKLPPWFPMDLRLRAAIATCVFLSDPFQAGQALRGLIDGPEARELQSHDVIAVHAVLWIADARFLELAVDLARRLHPRLGTSMGSVLRDWASLYEQIPNEALAQLASGVLVRNEREPATVFSLAPDVLALVHERLAGTPHLSRVVLRALPPPPEAPPPPVVVSLPRAPSDPFDGRLELWLTLTALAAVAAGFLTLALRGR